MEQDGKKQIIVTIAVLLAVVLIVGGVVAFTQRSKDSTSSSSTPATTTTSTTDTASSDSNISDTATFKDGSYTATTSYDSPGGVQSISVKVTLDNNTVSDVSVTSSASDGEAAEHQQDFKDNYKALVVGKRITSIQLDSVSGASLTTQGFNNAIQKIEAEAQA